MFGGSFTLHVDLPIVDTIHSKWNECVIIMGVKSKATDDSILNDSPVDDDIKLCCITLKGPYCMQLTIMV